MHICGAKFQEHCLNISRDIVYGSHTVFGKRIVFYFVTKEIERDTMKIYEIRRNCTRHDESIRDSMKLYETRQ